MKRVLIIILSAILLVGCAKNVGSTPDTATYDESARFDPLEEAMKQMATEPPTEPPTDPPTLEELAQARYDEILSKKSSGYAKLDNMTPLSQYPDMQAACEALALTAAINHFGYDLGKEDIVDQYLEYSNNFAIGYVGNPRRFYDGAGIYPPGMVKTVWNFVEATGARLYPFDTTGLKMDELYRFLDAGCPVLIWTTYDRGYPYFNGGTTYEGVYYPWFDTEHCVCLCGYDKGDGTVRIADSWYSILDWENASRFSDLYDEIGQFSMVLMDVSDLRGE